jgi:hypothetical protein
MFVFMGIQVWIGVGVASLKMIHLRSQRHYLEVSVSGSTAAGYTTAD